MEKIKQIFNEKIKAFFLHFLLSLFILTLISALVYFIWYPAPLLQAVGGAKILGLILLIDVILGPILTFIIYKKNKKTLKLDLSVIALIQTLALLLGLSSLMIAKPVWIAFNGNKFELIQKNEIIYPKEQTESDYLTSNYWTKPQFIAIALSQDSKTREQQIMDEVFTGISMAQHVKNYVPIENQKDKILNQCHEINELNKFNDSKIVELILKDYENITGWLPLKAKNKDMVVLIGQSAQSFHIVDLRPWN